MPLKTLRNLDIYAPNFDYMLLQKINNMTPDQRELIPPELKFKIFKKKEASVDNMNFTEKMYLLSVCFKQTVIIATMDEDANISAKEFKNVIEAQKGNLKNVDILEAMHVKGLFVQSDKELMRAWQYMNHLQGTDIYDLIKGAHPREASKRELKFKNYQRNIAGVVRAFANYESKKKDVLINFQISVPKLYALLYFYDGEKKGSDFYNIAFKHAYTSNRGDLSSALAELYQNGYLDRRGARKNMRYSITSRGIEFLIRILNKLIYNY